MKSIKNIVKKIIPQTIINSIKIQLYKRKFPKANINTAAIANNVEIDDYCSIAKNVEVQQGVKIGKYSYINSYSMVGVNTQIGKFCSIAYGTKIGLSEHPTTYISTSPTIYGKNNIFGADKVWSDHQSPVIIENDVWIGANSIIIQGVKVGNGAIVAAGAVVTQDVEPYHIVGGVPAKTIGKRFDLDTIAKLEKDKWWNWSEDKIKEHQSMFLAKNEWVKKYNP